MTYEVSVAIPICYPEEITFLRANISHIEKFTHPQVKPQVIICDQTGNDSVKSEFGSRYYVMQLPRVDAGYPLDMALTIADKEYFVSLDVDCVPMHKAWLYAPVKVLAEYPDIVMVGKATGLHNHHDYAKWGAFFHINNYFRFMRTDQARYVSKQVGFLRPENRHKAGFDTLAEFSFEPNCDNGVRANSFTDRMKMGRKFSVAMDRVLGNTHEMGIFGHTLDGLVWHMVFSSSKDWIEDKSKTLGEEYLKWYHRINTEPFDSVWPDIVKALQPKYNILHDRHVWDGDKEVSLTPQDQLFKDFSAWKAE